MCPPFCCKTHSRRPHHLLIPDACETFRHVSLHIKSPTSTKFTPFKQTVWMASTFPSFATLLLSISFTNLAIRLVLLNVLCWNSRSSCWKRNPCCWISPVGAVMKWRNIAWTCVFRTKRRLKFVKYRADCFTRLEDVSRQTVVTSVSGATLYMRKYALRSRSRSVLPSSSEAAIGDVPHFLSSGVRIQQLSELTD